jgi:hypothetical protein
MRLLPCFLAAAAAVATVGCGDDDAGCGPSTCAGCCLDGHCVSGGASTACGFGGAACVPCPSGLVCRDGACAASVDPCGGVPVEGRCASATRIELCAVATGYGAPFVQAIECPAGTECRVASGRAGCTVTGACRDGDRECGGATLRVCESGAWRDTPCAHGCVPNPLGAACAPDYDTVTRSGRLLYEARGPNASLTDWDAPVALGAPGFLVASFHGDELLDLATTADDAAVAGGFAVAVPAVPGPDDWLVFLAAGVREDGSLSFVVADPGLAAGTHDPGALGGAPAAWSWSIAVADTVEGETLTITEALGSGAARVYDYLRYVHPVGEYRWPGRPAGPVVAWLALGVEWSCGSCFGPWPTTVFDQLFDSQLWLGGGSDAGYWSDAVTAHELGHWAMQTFGRSPGEGGAHCLGVPVLPGMAWSEGWATWFSADVREDPVYVDKQSGAMFWMRIDGREYGGGYPWRRPDPGGGLLQLVDENEVSAMMWGLSAGAALGHGPIDRALAAPRLTVPPFERGYTRHTWSIDGACNPVGVEDSGESVPMFADFLDALVCAGASPSAVLGAVGRYPYPASAPLCR